MQWSTGLCTVVHHPAELPAHSPDRNGVRTGACCADAGENPRVAFAGAHELSLDALDRRYGDGIDTGYAGERRDRPATRLRADEYGAGGVGDGARASATALDPVDRSTAAGRTRAGAGAMEPHAAG